MNQVRNFASALVRLTPGLIGFIGCLAISIYILIPGDFYCESVKKVTTFDSALFLLTLDLESNYQRFITENLGETWQIAEYMDLPGQVKKELTYPSQDAVPTEICNPIQLLECYRFSRISNGIEFSSDEGQTWNSIKLPFRTKSKRGCEEPSPTSMTFFTDSNQNVTLIIGMGTGGIIMHSVQEGWSYHNIDSLHNRQ